MTALSSGLPSVEECFRLMDRHHMLPNIKAHSILVARIALLLAKKLAAGDDAGISADLAVAGALLHDIGKTACLNAPEDHAAKGAAICRAEQAGAVSDIVAQHVLLKNYDPAARLTETEIVYYADKRVNHDRIVNLKERLEYILSRYGKESSRLRQAIRDNFKRCVVIEKKIFSLLDFDPADLGEKVTNITLHNGPMP
jgi:uncharacterized protein